jgi:hypothetical protein
VHLILLYTIKKAPIFYRGTARYSKIWSTSPYDGFNTMIRFAKVSGYWQYSLTNNIESAEYDPNDLGFLSAPK